MATYRLYFIDRTDHITGVEHFECANDDEALREAERRFSANGLEHSSYEVWESKRLVGAKSSL